LNTSLLQQSAKQIAKSNDPIRNTAISEYSFGKYCTNYIKNGLRNFTREAKQNFAKFISPDYSRFNSFADPMMMFTSMHRGAGDIGGWKELGRTSAVSSPSNIDVTGLSDKRLLNVLVYHVPSVKARSNFGFNDDSGTNFCGRFSRNGGADATSTSVTKFNYTDADWNTSPTFYNFYVANYSSKEKLVCGGEACNQNTAGAGNAPNRAEGVAKWANTSAAINRVDVRPNAGTYESGSEAIVLGLDSADTHTDNFWGQLFAPNELSGAGDNLSSGTFTAKKYCRIMAFIKQSGTLDMNTQVNNDTSGNYASRYSDNGGADSTGISQSALQAMLNISFNNFIDIFFINVSSKEKLFIGHSVSQNTAGAGTAPRRREFVGKWANTSTQITEYEINNTGSGSFAAGSIIAGWGSD